METETAKRYDIATWAVVGLWFVYCVATVNYNGPFFDEAIYITAGQRGLEGFAGSDNYLTWFAGSMLWPFLAALGYHAMGLDGTRIVAVLLATIGFVAAILATRNLFGRQVGFWTALAMGLNGALLSLAHLGVYDLPALAGIGVSFWAITELVRRNNRAWLVLAALSYVFAVFSKYPIGLMLLPLAGVTLALRHRKAIMDLAIFGFIASALVLIFYIPLRAPLSQLGPYLAPQEILRQPANVTLAIVLYFSLLPILLALLGWCLARDRRVLASVLMGGVLIWPAYHLREELVVSFTKHLVFGYLFGYPLIGLALATVWSRWRHRAAVIAVVAALAVVGFIQKQQEDQIWPDVRTAASFLVSQVRPGDKLLINDSWPYIMYMYLNGRIEKPQDVIDIYSKDQSDIGICQYNWFVDSDYTPQWPASVRDAVVRCGTYRVAFSTASPVSLLNFSFDFIITPVRIVIWQNNPPG